MDYSLTEATKRDIKEKNLKFEKANIKDIDEIMNLFSERIKWFKDNNINQWRRYFEFQPKTDFENVIENGFYFILKQEGKIVAGFEIASNGNYWEDNNENAYYINKVVTKTTYRDLGSIMFKICKEIASNNGKSVLRLNCLESNKKLNNIYAKHGFKLVGNGIDENYKYSLREWTKI